MKRHPSGLPVPSQSQFQADLTCSETTLERSIRALDAAYASVPPEMAATPEVARSVQARQNRFQRMDEEFGLLGSGDIAELLGISKTNRNKSHQLAKAGQIIGVQRGRRILYPGFQFDQEKGKVRPVIAKVVAIARERWDGPSLLQWFCASNGFLDGKRPVDVIEDEEQLLKIAHLSLAEQW